jgi:hypothetical protein
MGVIVQKVIIVCTFLITSVFLSSLRDGGNITLCKTAPLKCYLVFRNDEVPLPKITRLCSKFTQES